jgi:hypothetical protein
MRYLRLSSEQPKPDDLAVWDQLDLADLDDANVAILDRAKERWARDAGHRHELGEAIAEPRLVTEARDQGRVVASVAGHASNPNLFAMSKEYDLRSKFPVIASVNQNLRASYVFVSTMKSRDLQNQNFG